MNRYFSPLLLWMAIATAATSQGTSTLEVKITWDGELPDSKALEIPKAFKDRHPEDASHCEKCIQGGLLLNEELLIEAKSKGIANVAAIPQGQAPSKAKPEEQVLINRDGRFSPHVQFIQKGASIRVSNADPFTHNSRITGRGNRQIWNVLLPPEGESKTVPFESPGLYTIYCDMHPWMKAYLIVTDQPKCGLSQADGLIRLTGLPAKTGQVVDLWHESLGRARITVDLVADKETKYSMTQAAFKR